MSNDLVTIQQDANPYALMPVLDMDMAMARRQAVINYTRKMLVKGTDFGVVPGTGDKPTLLKPGAEKLASLFGLSPLFEAVDRVMDWTGDAHGGEPFFYVAYRCTLTRGEIVAGQGVGSCNSWEKKYRWRQGERVCPECGKPAIIKGKADYGGGWLCFKKKDGCGYKFADNDPRIVTQQVGQVKNPDPADVVNTIDKMAQKRALVAAVLIAVNASEMFTQDVEDYSDVVDGDWTPAPPQQQPQAKTPPPAPRPTPATNGNSGNGNGQSDLGPLADDELTVSEASARDFLNVAAGLLETDADTVKERLHALGYSSIPGKPAGRVDAYRKLRADIGGKADGTLFDVTTVDAPGGAEAYQE
jgi:hypothetical protein